MEKQIAKILIVDDDPNLTGLLGDILRLKGFEPIIAHSGAAALKSVEQYPIQVVLIDLRLGDMNGLEVVKGIKARDPQIECILITGYASQNSAIDAVQLGVFGFFQKPFDMEQVLLSIQRAVEKKLAAEALHKSEERYRLLFENSPVGILSADIKGTISEANPTVLQILGSPSVEATQSVNLLTFPPLMKAGISANFKRCAETNESISDECQYTSIWEKSIYIQYHMTPISNANGKTDQLQVIVEDISERKRAEKRLHDASEFLQNVQDSLTAHIAILDEAGFIVQVNSAWRRFGELNGLKSPDDCIGLNYLNICYSAQGPDAEESGLAAQAIRDVMAGSKKEVLVEYPCHSPSEKRWFNLHVTKFENDGQTWLVLSHENITERKQAEENIRQQSEQLKLLYNASQRLNRTLDMNEIYETIRGFMSDVAASDGLVISAFDPETQLITCRAYWMENTWLDVSSFPSIPLEEEGKGTQSLVIRTGQAMLFNDFQAQVKTAKTTYYVNEHEVVTEVSADEEITRSALIVPLISGDTVSGVIQVLSYRQNAFTEEQLKLLESLALHISSAEKNARLFLMVQAELNERKQAEKALQENEAKYRNLFESATIGIFHSLPEGRFLQVNPTLAAMLGYASPAEMVSLITDIGSQIYVDSKKRAQNIADAFNQEGWIYSENRYHKKDGSILTANLSVRKVLKTDGTLAYLEGLVEDITERKQVEDTLRFLLQSNYTDEDFYHSLARHLASSLNMDYVCIDRLAGDQLSAQTLAIYFDGKFDDNVSYTLKDTPCGDVVGKSVCVFPNQVRHLFPLDVVLQEMPAESYVGTTLWSSQGKPIGLIAVIGRKPLDAVSQRLAESILKLTAVRAAGELERQQAEEYIRQNERRLRDAQAVGRIGDWEIDLVKGQLFYSDEMFELLERDPSLGAPELSDAMKYLEPQGAEKMQEMLMRAMETGEDWGIDVHVILPSGREVWHHEIGTIAKDSQGNVLKILGVAQDVTERKLAEDEIHQRLIELETLYENGLTLSQLLNPNEIGQKMIELLVKKMNWHHSVIRLYDPQNESLELLAFSHPTLKDESHKPVIEQLNKRISRAGEGLSGWAVKNSQVIRSGDLSNDPRYVETFPGMQSGMYVPMIVGERVVGVISIESERPNAFSEADERLVSTLANQAAVALENAHLTAGLEQRVKERTAQVQDLYDNAPTGYHSLDENGTIILINQTELNWLGYEREELVGVRPFFDLLTPTSQQTFNENFPRFKARGYIKDLELDAVRKDGSILPILVNATAIYDADGKYLHSRSTVLDVTVRRQIENALLESWDKLSLANKSLETAARIKDDFLASMSHELRTPLTGILGLSEALQLKTYGDMSEIQLKALKNIEDSGRHLLELINDILDLSKIEAGKLDLQFAPCSLGDICQASLQLTKGMAQHKHQQVHYVPSAEPVLIFGDARRLKQILANLLSNAIKFTAENGELGLEVQADHSKGRVELTVWDKGIGILSKDLPLLFTPFTQIDSSLAREYSGTGLGLSLVKRLTEMHNGGIEVKSTLGEGSRFTVFLPWSPQNTTPLPRMTNPSRPVGTGPLNLNSLPTILFADDNEIVLQMIADFLETKHYRVVKVRSGFELLERVAEFHPDLMLVDIQMPGMDGMETIRRIRAHSDPLVAKIPVIAVTALAMPGDRERCLQAGANEYMSKPLRLKELAAIIQKQTGKKS